MLELPPKYPPVLCELADCVYRCLSASLPVERAGRLALDITGALQRQFVGCLLYIPKGEEFERERRNDALLRDSTSTAATIANSRANTAWRSPPSTPSSRSSGRRNRKIKEEKNLDGVGHRRDIQAKKTAKNGRFLLRCSKSKLAVTHCFMVLVVGLEPTSRISGAGF